MSRYYKKKYSIEKTKLLFMRLIKKEVDKWEYNYLIRKNRECKKLKL